MPVPHPRCFPLRVSPVVVDARESGEFEERRCRTRRFGRGVDERDGAHQRGAERPDDDGLPEHRFGDGAAPEHRAFAVGKPYQAADINVRDVTFDADDNRFYATVATDGHRYLAEGDPATRTLHDNVECPSLSPDGTRIAYKKRLLDADPSRPWRLYTLDLRTAETRTLDDQAEWLDTTTVLYTLPGDLRTDIWSTPADGKRKPKVLVKYALSPTVLRNRPSAVSRSRVVANTVSSTTRRCGATQYVRRMLSGCSRIRSSRTPSPSDFA